MRKTLEQAEQASNPSNEERIALENGMAKFSLRVLNRMSHDRGSKWSAGCKLASAAAYIVHTTRRTLNCAALTSIISDAIFKILFGSLMMKKPKMRN
jgi:hypothetical protein